MKSCIVLVCCMLRTAFGISWNLLFLAVSRGSLILWTTRPCDRRRMAPPAKKEEEEVSTSTSPESGDVGNFFDSCQPFPPLCKAARFRLFGRSLTPGLLYALQLPESQLLTPTRPDPTPTKRITFHTARGATTAQKLQLPKREMPRTPGFAVRKSRFFSLRERE